MKLLTEQFVIEDYFNGYWWVSINSYKNDCRLDSANHFDNTRNMETKNIITALSALAQESRLTIFRLLVEAGPGGLPVRVIAETLNLANATLSFHLKELTHAGLTIATPSGRSIIYTADFITMNGLVDYLTENCCGGSDCAPCPPAAVRMYNNMPVKNPSLKLTSIRKKA